MEISKSILEGFSSIQTDLLACQAIPVLGVIPAAIQVIVCVGELIASFLESRQAESDELFYDGITRLGFSLLNIVCLGLFVPFLLVCDE